MTSMHKIVPRLFAVLIPAAVLVGSPLGCDSGGGSGGGTGGDSSGGASNEGGAASGDGGSNSGGSSATGGSNNQGGADTGGAGTGGAASGGSSSGGSAAGGAGTGGATGGSAGGGAGGASKNGTEMSFFVTSVGKGMGGDLDGLAGADLHCKTLAKAVNAVRKEWIAYLSVANGGNNQAINAKDRIGTGPWYNQKKAMFAMNLTALHPTINPAADRAGYIAAKPADALFMDEKGVAVPSGVHDIMTGTKLDGTLETGKTCMDWTVNNTGVTRVGHSDTPGPTQYSPSWNSAHDTQGCSQQGVSSGGGNGRFYCFATD